MWPSNDADKNERIKYTDINKSLIFINILNCEQTRALKAAEFDWERRSHKGVLSQSK